MELVNNEVEMAEAKFKATYLEKEVKVESMKKLIPEDLLPLIGKYWPKRLVKDEGQKAMLIESLEKVVWRVCLGYTGLMIKLMKKEDKDSLFNIFAR